MASNNVVSELNCPNCGAPLNLTPGELVATCRYCGYTSVVGANTPFQLEHSLILNRFNNQTAQQSLIEWMHSGFMKPGDLAKKSKILLLELRYLPFWVVPVVATSKYEGIVERIAPPSPRNGTMTREYDWLVFGRKGSEFPTRDYSVPATGKIPFDFTKIDPSAKFLNSEMDSSEAVELAKEQVDQNQRFLAKQQVDQITSFNTDFKLDRPTYLHAPLWFIQYEYKSQNYAAIMDGNSGIMIRADYPQTQFKMI